MFEFGTEISVNWVMLPRQAVLNEKFGLGPESTVTGLTMVSIHPPEFITISRTLYVPTALNRWMGDCVVAVLFTPESGSPKFQLHSTTAPPPLSCEISENCTFSFSQALVKSKFEVGAGVISTGRIFTAEHPRFVVTVRVTE